MFRIIFHILFIITAALASLGIGLSLRLRKNKGTKTFSPLLYFQVFIFTFGFYGVWGQVFIKSFFESYISGEILTRFSNISLFMGLPFLVFAWMMLIQFSFALSGGRTVKWFIPGFLTANFSILFTLGYIIAARDIKEPLELTKHYYIFFSILYSLAASGIIFFTSQKNSVISSDNRKLISLILPLITLLQCSVLVFYNTETWLAGIFIFIFFSGSIFLPFYLSYCTVMKDQQTVGAMILSFEDFCSKYDISPRESDIIREICNGLSNKEISERLFISLQTVKDHTHRIYIKTNVRSRVQLINLVKDIKIIYPS